MAQRVVQYQTVLQMSQQAPQIYNLPQLHRQMIEVLGVKNADKLVPTEDDVNPTDPVSENMNALTGTPHKSVSLSRPRSSYRGSPVVYERPHDRTVYWAEPTGTADYGSSQCSYRRAPRV